MANSVEISITSHPLSREENGVIFVVSTDGGKLGELTVSKGGIRWKPKNKHDGHFMKWAELDQTMRDKPRK